MEETVKILVVDDDQVDRMAVRRALKVAGVKMELSEIGDCAGAIAVLQQQQFDCVFLDYLLPDGDGLNLVQQVRALGIKVPLVVLTGQGDEQIAVQVMKAGADDYLSKEQISPENLAQVLRNVIRIYKAEMEVVLANQRLQASEERYRLVLEAANDGIWDWYCATDEVYCNDRLLEIMGVSRAEFSLTPAAFIEQMHPEDLPRIKATITNHLIQGEKCEVEFRLRHSSGEYRYCIARGKAQRDRFGCPLRMSGILSDVTESKRLEQALRASESRFRRLADANIIGIILVDLNGDILEANDAFLQMVGYSRREMLNGKLDWQKMTPPEYQQLDQQAIAQLKQTGAFNSIEKEYLRKDGSRVPILIGAAMVEHLDAAICFVVDLSDRKQSEAEIIKLNRDLERRISELETLLDVIPIGIAIAQDPKCQQIRLNPVMAKLLELAPDTKTLNSSVRTEQLPNKIYSNGKELGAAELPMEAAAASGVEVLNAEINLVKHNGGKTTKLIGNAAPLFDEQGLCRGSVGAFLDITERKWIEEQERFLADASAILATSLDYQTTLENLARLVVPQWADWCSVHIVQDDNSLHEVAVAHIDPVKVRWAQELQRRYPINPNAPFGPPQVLRSGQSELYSNFSDSQLLSSAYDAEHLRLLQQMNIKSLICVPMKARGRTLGAITFSSAESERIYTQVDLALAEDLGRRAGLAVDNARLYQEANEIGENLRQAIIILGEQQQQLRVLQRITNLLNQRLTNLPSLLQVMIGAVRDGVPDAQFAVIALYNSASDRLELTATNGIAPESSLLQELLHSATGLLSQVFLTGASQLIKESKQPKLTPHSSLLTPHPLSRSPASVYAVALSSAQAGKLGVLAIGNWENPNAFDIEDQNLLSAVGEQAAIAINNARLISALEEREERLAVQNRTLAQQNDELELTRQRIEQQNVQLIEAARMKSQFLATMSHELRTPMNAVIGFAQVLLRQRSASLSNTQIDMVERILNNGKNLMALINDILDLSKIEAGRLELKPEEINLTHLVLATVSELKPLADQKQLRLKIDAELENPIIINDSTRLRQILVNLLSNAIKFTETGSVEVKVRELSPTQLVLCVQDTGIGIAESEIEHIFEEFRQVDQTTTRKHGGTGLGLAITQSLVNMMQGTITVQSQLDKGSTFRVELPRQVQAKE